VKRTQFPISGHSVPVLAEDVLGTVRRLESNMKFCIEVGEIEKHLVEFNFNQLLGQVVIKVNRKEVSRKVRLINEPVREVHTIPVGEGERHVVRIEKERKQLLGSRCRVFLNDRLYKYYEGV